MDYARRYSRDARTIPTVVDTETFVPDPRRNTRSPAGAPIVGWIGSPTTPPTCSRFSRRCRRWRAAIPGVNVENVRWTLENEVALFNTCDAGIYPMPDDEWAGGKCGFKAIQFMACGVPVVASAVGVNREIVQDGVNGFLATSPAEWVEKLSRLIADPALRRTLGDAGRRTVEARYSLRATAPRLVSAVLEAMERAGQ